MLLASVSMVAATQQQLVQKRSTIVDVLQGATAVCVLVDVLLNHVLKIVRQGRKLYLSSLWNILETIGCSCLLVATGAYFAGQFFLDGRLDDVLQTAGATGTVLKWIGLMDYFRSFSRTGPLIRMVMVVAEDMAPFLGVLWVVLLGATLFFVIDLPGQVRTRPQSQQQCHCGGLVSRV